MSLTKNEIIAMVKAMPEPYKCNPINPVISISIEKKFLFFKWKKKLRKGIDYYLKDDGQVILDSQFKLPDEKLSILYIKLLVQK